MALDSFIGEGLSMSPYQESLERYERLMKQHTELLDKYAVLTKKYIEVNTAYNNFYTFWVGEKTTIEAGDLP